MAALIAISIAIGITMVIFSVGIVALVVVAVKDKEKKQTPQQAEKQNALQTSILVCPVCGTRLSFMMPDGRTLYCNKCNKYFKHKHGMVGEECKSPYTKNNVQY